MMKKSALTILGTLAAIAVAAFPATTAAHGEDPDDEAVAIAKALKSPLIVRGTARITIVHVQRGCHSWSTGKAAPLPGVKIFLRRGQRLSVLNQDVDTHKLVRLAGPKVALGMALSMNDRLTLTFKKAGVYKLRTKKMASPGMSEVKTIGPDKILAMVVVVR